MKTSHIIKRLKEDSAYQEFFKKALKKFDIASPADLKDAERKKHFFDYIDKNYSGKTEGRLSEDYFPVHGADSPDVKKTKAALAAWFKNIRKNVPGMFPQVFDELHDLIDDYATAYAEEMLGAADQVMANHDRVKKQFSQKM